MRNEAQNSIHRQFAPEAYRGECDQDPCLPASLAGSGPSSPEFPRLLNSLWRRKWRVGLAAAAGALAGLLAAGMQTPLYRSRALLEIQGLNENFLNLGEVMTTGDGPRSPTQADLQTQLKILTSRPLIEAVERRLNRESPRDGRRTNSSLRSLGQIGAERPAHDEAVRSATENLRARSWDGSRIVEIEAASTDGPIAAAFVNMLAAEYIDESLRVRSKNAQDTKQWLLDQLRLARENLERAERILREYARDQELLFTSEEKAVEEDKLRQLQASLSRAEEERVERQSRYELAVVRAPDTLPETLDDATLAIYRAKLTDLRREYAELSAIYTDEHGQVKQVLAQIETIEPILEREYEKTVSRVRNEFEAAALREKLLAGSLAHQKKQVARRAESTIGYNILAREAENARQLHDTLLRRVNEAGIASALRALTIRVVEPATPPREPYKPAYPLNALMGAISAAFCALVVVSFREHSPAVISQTGDAGALLGLIELGTIAAAEAGRRISGDRKKKLVLRVVWRRTGAKPRPAAPKPKPIWTDRVELAAWRSKVSPMAESVRATRTSLLLRHHGGERPKSFLVTSAGPGDGATTAAANLAISMAEAFPRTLLIDADLRHPRLHEVFGVPGGPGFNELLGPPQGTRPVSVEECLRDTGIPGLSLLPAGSAGEESPFSLYLSKTENLLRRVESDFDLVVIDAPSAEAGGDARVLTHLADATVLVLRANRTSVENALRARNQIVADGGRLLGTILNAWSPSADARRRGEHQPEDDLQRMPVGGKERLAASA